MPAPSKTLSPTELAKLEHAFASDPSSDAYKPLAEAYLGMGRFMEAMVVCKKGVKAHPGSADPRVLLSRVYAEQGKDKKALEELLAALQVAPADKTALRLAGVLQLKGGETEAGKQNLLKAYAADPADPDTTAALKEWKIEAPRSGPSASAAPQGAPPVLTPGMQPLPVSPRAAARAEREATAPSAAVPEALTHRPRRTSSSPSNHAGLPNGATAVTAATDSVEPAPRRTSRPRVAMYEEEEDEAPRRRKNRSGFSMGLVVVMVVGTLGFWGYSHFNRVKKAEVGKYLSQTIKELRRDSFDSYKKATEAAEQAVHADPDNADAHAYLAYAWAVRWGEHGGGPEAKANAEKNLAEAMSGEKTPVYAVAARGLIDSYGGKAAEASSYLSGEIRSLESQGNRPVLLYLTQGLVLMNSGDLEEARTYLEKAKKEVQDDPRIYSALGILYRRMGDNVQASTNYKLALQFGSSHQESMLGQALLLLEQDNPLYKTASDLLKKLVESQPPPSPKQLAMAQVARGWLISKVAHNISDYAPEDQKKILAGTGVPADKSQALMEAARQAKEGLTINENPDSLILNGKRLLEESKVDEALTQFKKAIELDKSRAQSYVELAKAYLQKPGGETDAQKVLTDAIKSLGERPRLMVTLGQTYLRQGKTEEALSYFQKAVGDGKSRNPDAWHAMGRIYLEKKDFPKAQDALEKAVTELFGQASKLAEAYTDLARAAEGKQDRTKADDAYQKAIAADADYTPAYFFYARFLSSDSKTEPKSKSMAQEYLKREPKGPYAAEAGSLVSAR